MKGTVVDQHQDSTAPEAANVAVAERDEELLEDELLVEEVSIDGMCGVY